jgi:hypothetical protein
MSTVSLFKNPFMPKKAPIRKATTISPLQMDAIQRGREFDLDYSSAHFMLGVQHYRFDLETGEWFDGPYKLNLIYFSIACLLFCLNIF